MTRFMSWRWWDQAVPTRYRITRQLFLRGLGIVYLSAFGSLAVQLDGLIGANGILPAAEYLERSRDLLGTGFDTYWRVPTVFWIDASDRALHTVCILGICCALMLAAGVLPGLCVVVLWASYLSLVSVGQVFLGYQWDSLLLETGFLAILIAPWGFRLDRAHDQPWRFSVGLVRWLAFRLMFLSGFVKLASHDPTWQSWRALEHHYQTQPLPTWTSWYIHQMPASFHWFSVAFMFYAELMAPFFIFGPRPMRIVGFVSLVFLQAMIAATGNYGFFNLLSVVICLCILDDRDYGWLFARLFKRPKPVNVDIDVQGDEVPAAKDSVWSWPRRAGIGLVGGIVVAITATQTIETISPTTFIPSELMMLAQWAEPSRSTNTYGLFAVMTTTRPEIVIEGSDDGTNWLPYRFRWKPCELDRRPRFALLHLPRLDWQMWFAALAGDCRAAPWFFRFEQKLFESSPAVLGLLREHPFSGSAPKYLRARLYSYTFTRKGSPDWWAREDRGFYCPPLSAQYFQ